MDLSIEILKILKYILKNKIKENELINILNILKETEKKKLFQRFGEKEPYRIQNFWKR